MKAGPKDPAAAPLLDNVKKAQNKNARPPWEAANEAQGGAGPSQSPKQPPSPEQVIPVTEKEDAHELMDDIHRVWWLTPAGVKTTIITEVVFAEGIYSVLLLSFGALEQSIWYFQIALGLYVIGTLFVAAYLWYVYQHIQEVHAEWVRHQFSTGLPYPNKELALAFIENNGLGVGGAIDKIIGERRTTELGMHEIKEIGKKAEWHTTFQYYVVGFLYSIWFLLVWGLIVHGKKLYEDSHLLFWACIALVAIDALCVIINLLFRKVPLCFCFPGVFFRPEVDHMRQEEIYTLKRYPFLHQRPTSPSFMGRRKASAEKEKDSTPGGGYLRGQKRENGKMYDYAYRRIPGDDAHCKICGRSYEDEQSIMELPWCKHHFHEGCIEKWLRFTKCYVCKVEAQNPGTPRQPAAEP